MVTTKLKLVFLAMLPIVLAGQTSQYRILYPPHATLAGASASGPVEGGAQGSSNLFPVVTGNGWSVDMGKGALSIVVPVGTVPGELPIPLTFRFNASQAFPVVKASIYVAGGAGAAVKTAGMSPMIGTGGRYASGFARYNRPIFGTVDFGFISSGDGQSVPGTDDDLAGKFDSFTPNSYYVLEDGTVHSQLDFSTMGGTFSLPPRFGFSAKAASAVSINSVGTLVTYPAVASDLGSWATQAAGLAPVGFTAGAHTGYKVVMDRDRARVYAYAQELYAWVPILWVDRFGHWVGFQWKNTTSGLPSGIASVRSVKVLNHRNKGVQVQWAEPTAGSSAPLGIYLRADFINIQAPTLQATGYPDLAGTMARTILPLAAGPDLRPTTLQIGNPLMGAPNWLQLPVPSPVGSGAWPSQDLSWAFNYVTPSLDELASFTDSRGLTTVLGWQTTTLLDPTAAATGASQMVDIYRSVHTAVSTDSGMTLSRTWTWNLPAAPSATVWQNAYSQAWSGTQSWNDAAIQAGHRGRSPDLDPKLQPGVPRRFGWNHFRQGILENDHHEHAGSNSDPGH
ncbi:hypothetical protein [Mesoterricola silvestris]|uniref:Uncharacterized protein n=1 Tax=Mesoterricola silvestris TaxID=2927979 RepID=A0AA48GM56_9BACT|nr:hypothetical protein [Mesoterricola silvestris]BDU72025.1 hypothetical protein METEAL_11990 [Mesoterricola silvestris]